MKFSIFANILITWFYKLNFYSVTKRIYTNYYELEKFNDLETYIKFQHDFHYKQILVYNYVVT